MKHYTILRKAVAIAMIVSFASATSGCFGPFNLTRNVYHWNSEIKGSGEVNDKWMKEFVFFGMIIIPVYMFSALLDAFIFNSIQFWTGDNPVKAEGQNDSIREVRIGEKRIAVSWAKNRQSAKVTYSQDGAVIMTATIIQDNRGVRLIDPDGRTLYAAERSHDGSVAFVDHECRLLDRLSLDQLQAGAKQLEKEISSQLPSGGDTDTKFVGTSLVN